MNSARAEDLWKESGGISAFAQSELLKASLLNRPELPLRAPPQAIHVLDGYIKQTTRRSMLPKHVGQAWIEDKETKGEGTLKSGVVLGQIDTIHARTLGEVEGRLDSLGLNRPVQPTTNTFEPAGSEKQGIGRSPSGTERRGS